MTGLKRQSLALFIPLAIVAMLCSGCGDSVDNYVFTNTNNGSVTPPPATPPPIILAPTANNDTFVTLGNSTLNQASAAGVLVNDTVNGASISSFDANSTKDGAVTLAADGGFTYSLVGHGLVLLGTAKQMPTGGLLGALGGEGTDGDGHLSEPPVT